MGTNDNIHQPLAQILQCSLLSGRGAEPGKHIYPHRKILHSLYKGIVMLLRQYGGRHQIHHLLVVLNRLKSSSQRNFCFAIPHIPAD